MFKCPFCEKKYAKKSSLYEHMSNIHKESLEGLPPARVYFNFKYNKVAGKCVVCGSETPWVDKIERYDRICCDKCRLEYREIFKKRMVNKYGKICLLDDPKQQEKMLANRKISGEYQWSNSSYKTKYTGSYELDFLKFIDLFLSWEPNDIFSPSPHIFEYQYENKSHFYMPDFYIPSINLIVEIKDGGSNPNTHPKFQEVDKVKEKIKDEILEKQDKFNYLKIENKQYGKFLEYLLKVKEEKIKIKEGNFIMNSKIVDKKELNEDFILVEKFLMENENLNEDNLDVGLSKPKIIKELSRYGIDVGLIDLFVDKIIEINNLPGIKDEFKGYSILNVIAKAYELSLDVKEIAISKELLLTIIIYYFVGIENNRNTNIFEYREVVVKDIKVLNKYFTEEEIELIIMNCHSLNKKPLSELSVYTEIIYSAIRMVWDSKQANVVM